MSKAVIIGAGLGGLSAAVSLAAEGYSVEVFEKNDKVGGKLNVIEQEGFRFDLGPSILILPQVFESLFRRAGANMAEYVGLQEVRPHWRNFFEDGSVMDLSPDMRLMEQQLEKGEPGERFYAFLEYSREQYQRIAKGYFARGYDTLAEFLRGYGTDLRTIDFTGSMDGAAGKYIEGRKLRDTLDYFIKYVGSSPYDAPAFMNLLAYAQFGYGLWYVRGGMYNLARGLQRLAEQRGVTIHCNSEVVRIETQGERVTGVSLKDGTARRADIVVSDMEVIPAYRRLLHEPEKFLRKYRRFAPSCSGLVLHLGINTVYPQLAHHNFFYARDARKHFDNVFHRHILSDDPTIYLVAPSVTDPSLAPRGCSIIKALPHIPHLDEDRPFSEEEYLAFEQRVLEKLERQGLTNLRKHIVVRHRWTPDDIERAYFSNKGAIYGVVTDRRKNLGFKAPKQSEKYENLYFVGGSVNPGGGMPMVTMSGMRVCDLILRRSPAKVER